MSNPIANGTTQEVSRLRLGHAVAAERGEINLSSSAVLLCALIAVRSSNARALHEGPAASDSSCFSDRPSLDFHRSGPGTVPPTRIAAAVEGEPKT